MSKYKDKKPSMIEFTRKYANNDQACEEFFFRSKYPNGYYCEKCGCTHYKKISTSNHVYTCSKCGHQSCLFAGHSFKIANWTCISCCLACLSSSLPTKVSVQ